MTSGGGGNPTTSETGGGGGGAGTNSDIVASRGRPDELDSGSESVATASGPQSDMSNLIGDPRDLVQKGGGNSAANDSDAVHAALSAVDEEQRDTTSDKYSVAGDGDVADAAAATSVAVAAASVVYAVGAVATAAGEGLSMVGTAVAGGATGVALGAAGVAGYALGSAVEEDFGDAIHGVDTKAETEYKATLGRLEGENRKEARQKGGGVGTPGDPDDDRRDGPPTEAEQALRAATNRLLGRNDALVHGPATQIDPGEQGEVFQRGNTPLATSAERAEQLFGQPADPDGRSKPRSDPNQTPPPPGPDGTEILVEDGNPFTGGQRNEGPEDIQFGRVEPLIGLDGGAGDDALPPEDDGQGVGGKQLARSLFSIDDDD